MSNKEQIEMQTMLPVQVIIERLAIGDELSRKIWAWCATEWTAAPVGVTINPTDYFIQPEDEPTDTVVVSEENEYPDEESDEPVSPPVDDDGDDIDDSDPDSTDPEPEEPVIDTPEPTDEEIELLATERSYLDALRQYWLELEIFKILLEDEKARPACATLFTAVNFVPSDLGKLCDHVDRINKLRIAAESYNLSRASLSSLLTEAGQGRF